MTPRSPLATLSRNAAVPLVMAIGSALAGAQVESQAIFDAPVVVRAERDAPFGRLIDLAGNGFMDSVGTKVDFLQSRRIVSLFRNSGSGGLFNTSWSESFIDPVSTAESVLRDQIVVGDFLSPDGIQDFAVVFGKRVRIYACTATGFTASLSTELATPSPVLGAVAGNFKRGATEEFALLMADELWIESRDASGWHTESIPVPPHDWLQLQRAELTGDALDEFVLVSADLILILNQRSPIRSPGNALSNPMFRGPRLHGLEDPIAAVGDVDGDGDDDVVLFSSAGYRILRQNAPGDAQLEALVSGGPATELADVDGDGDLDGISCSSGPGPAPAHVIYESGPDFTYNYKVSHFEISLNQSGTGDFAPAFSIPSLGAEHIAGAADLDHDGDVDLIAGRVVYYSPGTIAPSLPSPAAVIHSRAVADWDGDGDPDFELGAEGVIRNLGDGSASFATPLLPAAPPGMEFHGPGYPGDFDGNGSVDLLVEAWTGSTFSGVHLLRNAGGGSFTDGGLAMSPSSAFSSKTTLDPEASLAADLDGDGDIDLVVRSVLGFARFSWLWLNDGGGTFTEGALYDQNLDDYRVLAVGDVTADGKADLLVFGFFNLYPYYGLLVKPGLGSGQFGPAQMFVGMESGMDEARDEIALLRAAAGPWQDMIRPYRFANPDSSSNPARWFGYNTANHNFDKLDLAPYWFLNYGRTLGTPDYSARCLSADLDGNGWDDLVFGPIYYAPNTYAIYMRNSVGAFSSAVRQVFEPAALVDVDGDGDIDAIGDRIVKSRVIEGAEQGHRLQYGLSTVGTGGVTPTLGVRGPLTALDQMELRMTGGRGGASVVLAISGAQANAQNTPIPGITTYVDTSHPAYRTYSFVLSGTPGAPGAGSLSVPFTIPASYAGTTEYLQIFVTDPGAPGGMSATNGLRIDYGE